VAFSESTLFQLTLSVIVLAMKRGCTFSLHPLCRE
jgi:hypothetical protein